MTIFSGFLRKNSSPQGTSLDNLQVASPCPVEWSTMAGDDRKRHCSACNLNVYNLSGMTEPEVRTLLGMHQGQRLCVRFYRRADGTVLTQNCPWSLRVLAKKASRLGTAVLTAVLSVNFAAAKTKAKPACECQQTQQKDSGLKLTVMDQQGALIPNAEITLQKKSGAEKISGKTGPEGDWSQSQLAQGKYNVTVQAPGFQAFQGRVQIEENRLLGLKITLPVAPVNATVTVTAEPVVIQGTVVGVIEGQKSAPISTGFSGGRYLPMRR